MIFNDLSYSAQYVYLRAGAEANQIHRGRPGIEYWFLGLLTLSEVVAKDTFRLPEEEVDLIFEDIAAVKETMREYGIDIYTMRESLRNALIFGVKSDPWIVEEYIRYALKTAKQRGKTKVWAIDLLKVLLEKPTLTLKGCLPVKDQENDKPKGAASAAGKKENKDNTDLPPAAGKDSLPVLTERVRRMRTELLKTVQGQDHVIHAFAEGLFAAEVLAPADEKRARPCAVFAFVGPAGVGKTFLAEQAAQGLGRPYYRFDMSTYADHQSFHGLVGFEKTWKDSQEGVLTGFVKKNPHSILLFDEIEKAHLNTVHLFLQILDAGHLKDLYHDEDVSFKDTIIIFTSNAGKSLYEGEARQNAACVPRKILLNALETETDPRTGHPFFPPSITSRLATGWPLLFNHLEPHDLELISRRESDRFCEKFKTLYGFNVSVDPFVSTALLLKEGGKVDARTLRAQTELFFKNEVFKVCRLWGEERFQKVLSRLRHMYFTLETDEFADDVRTLFFSYEKPEILLYGSPGFLAKCRRSLPGFVFHGTDSVEEALEIAGEKDIRFTILDITERSVTADFMTAADGSGYGDDFPVSGEGFDYLPMAAGAFQDGVRLFRKLMEYHPEIPVYLLETEEFSLDEELTTSFVQAGARGKLAVPADDFSVFKDRLDSIARQTVSLNAAARLAAEHKVLAFDTAPKLSADGREITVQLRNFSLHRAPDAEDAESVLDEVEKPKVRFSDVIGCRDAKDELRFFTDFLKNPKKYAARGLKPPKGVLLYGPPGTGKTMLAKAMAGESDVAFLPAVASSFVTRFQGSGPESVRELFKKARRYAPSIVFIDELDAIGRKRGGINSGHSEEMALNALLTEMDGFSTDPRRPVFVLGATNFDIEEQKGGIGVLDPALIRRFDRRILVDLPDAQDREELLRLLLGTDAANRVSDNMIRRTAERSIGMSPANLTGIVDLAGRMAVKAGTVMDDAIFDEAFELNKHGEKRDWGYDYLERVARHESGHAFLCCLSGKTPSYLTIIARGNHGGYTENPAYETEPISTKEELIRCIRASLGGRAAEIVYYGEKEGVSTSASGDLEQATNLAAAMLCSYGMDDSFGLATMDLKEAMHDAALRGRVNEILGEQMRETVSLIRNNKHRVDRLVDALLMRNKLTGEEIEALLY